MEKAVKETKIKKLDLLAAVEKIVDLSKGSGLSPEFYRQASRYIKHLATRLNLTKEQSVMLAIFIDNCEDNSITLSKIARHLNCRTTRMIRYSNEIDELVRRDMIIRSKSSRGVSYRVPLDVIEAFKKDEAFTPRDRSGLTCQQLFNEMENIFEMVEDDEMDAESAKERLEQLLESNRQLAFVQKVNAYELCGTDLILLLQFCHLFVNNDDDCVGFHNLNSMHSKGLMRCIKSEFTQGDHELQQMKLIEWSTDGDFAKKEYYRLTMEAKRNLLDELQLPTLEGDKPKRGVLKADAIKPRNLFYSADITHSIDELAGLLDPQHYDDIHARLQEQGFRCGFTCLFYGAPGTGKTETVLQLARRTGRDILQVNVSEIKSMWVGESEKNIKAVFDSYRRIAKESKLTPILLFNEADAIIGKRQEGAERAVDKMENSIQNIILQEMETLDGILIATTNLAQNMDKAFERRFLYKIRFDKPTVEARASIWHEMLPTLSDADATKLAERYDFSGGQIENIARHYAIDAILHGTAAPTAETLAPHCDNERIDNRKERKIGF